MRYRGGSMLNTSLTSQRSHGSIRGSTIAIAGVLVLEILSEVRKLIPAVVPVEPPPFRIAHPLVPDLDGCIPSILRPGVCEHPEPDLLYVLPAMLTDIVRDGDHIVISERARTNLRAHTNLHINLQVLRRPLAVWVRRRSRR